MTKNQRNQLLLALAAFLFSMSLTYYAFRSADAYADHPERLQFVILVSGIFVSALVSWVLYLWIGFSQNAREISSQTTVRKKAQENAAASEKHLRDIFDSTYIFAGVLSTDGDLLEASDVSLKPPVLNRDGVIGKPIWDLYWSNYSPSAKEKMKEAALRAAAGEVVRDDFLIRIGEGRFVTVDVLFSPLRDSSGRVTYVTGFGVDITERQSLEKKILRVKEEEKLKIAVALHDGLCQDLLGISLGLKLREKKAAASFRMDELAHLAGVRGQVELALGRARDLSKGLYPMEIASAGLETALQELCAFTQERTGIECHFRAQGHVSLTDPHSPLYIYRIVQEALTNALKHSKGKNIWVDLEVVGEKFKLTVKDDGKGLSDQWDKNGGMGRHLMVYQARLVGGTLRFQNNPDKGASVALSLNMKWEGSPVL